MTSEAVHKSDEWQCLCEEQNLTDENHTALGLLSRDALLQIIPELACAYPGAGALLKNKWLTPPHDILSRVGTEYGERTKSPGKFLNEADAERWLHELACAVIAPLDNVPPEKTGQAETFILHLLSDETRLADIAGSCDCWSWRHALHQALSRLAARKIPGSEIVRPDGSSDSRL